MSKLENTVKVFKEIHPNYVLMFRFGKFYRTYGRDSYILAYLFGYKLSEIQGMQSAGFPTGALNKVMTRLEAENINYSILNKSNQYNEEHKENFKIKNRYNEVYELAKKDISVRNRIERIHSTLIENLNKEGIKEKIVRIEKVLYGK